MSDLLLVKNLSITFTLPQGMLRAVQGVDLSIGKGETVALVGESGCGKSITAYAVMGLVPSPGHVTGGEILFEGKNLLALSQEEMRHIRGNRISMIFQEPMTSLNPVFTVGGQIVEGLRLHRGIGRKEARDQGIDLLKQVGIASPASRFDEYPHQLSGGMRQRVMIAMSLACNPQLLIADEPTTALDVTIQAQILELMENMKEKTGMGLLLITHDLGIVAEHSDRTAVMYAGRIVEYATTAEILGNPRHPYTEGLISSLPQEGKPGEPLKTIPGSVPDLMVKQPGCGFCNRCPVKHRQCEVAEPELKEITQGHLVRCWNYR